MWPMVLSWLSSLILALLAVFVMLFTTFGNVGYMQSCVKSSGYAQSAYDDMVQDFISYGAATGFDADVMTGFMSVDQVESDMQDAVAGLYAKTLTYYTRDNIAEAVYSAMEQATADRGITLEGDTKTAVETVAEAVRMEYASYTAVPLVSQLRTLVQKLQKVMVIGLVVSAVLLCAAVVSMLHISRKDAHLGGALPGVCPWQLLLWYAWCWVWAFKPMIGLTRLGIDPPSPEKPADCLCGRFVWPLCGDGSDLFCAGDSAWRIGEQAQKAQSMMIEFIE